MILQSRSWAYTREKHNSKKDTHTPVFTAALCTTTRTWKQPECPSTKAWIKKIWYIYTMEYYSAIKRNKRVHCNEVDERRACYTE